jgi:hypothetical protein
MKEIKPGYYTNHNDNIEIRLPNGDWEIFLEDEGYCTSGVPEFWDRIAYSFNWTYLGPL